MTLEGGEWSAARPSCTLPPGKTQYPFYRRLGEPQGRSERAENLTPTKIRSWTVQSVAQSLYQLSYLAHLIIQGYYKRNRHFQRYVVSPDLTPCDFYLWGYIKDRFFIPPLPVSLNELKQRVTTAVASVDEDMLRSVWTEIDYRIHICRVTKGSHIEHL